ncbi:galactoside O-acetyltransferase [Enterococcus florum]|uniref:Acetyltransferase n=1 Tax=Enterococcus florum TaxID=2480627 RepID=A0A4P5PET1_9ENTE|nr:sugar O-acetyltransferase [Enterococcus florum]GCF94851.1 galactoside O-acetyltransferase [Enterococcus florum]
MISSKWETLLNSGEIYYEDDSIGKEQAIYRDLLFRFNHTLPSKTAEKHALLQQLLGSFGEDSYIEGPFSANWGKNTYIGKNVYANFNLSLVDDARITIKDDVMIGPNVTLCTGTHPLEPALRKKRAQFNSPIVIEENVWIGTSTIVLPGVTIGKNSVIGAGSIVTKDVPENVLAYGSPCRVIKSI